MTAKQTRGPASCPSSSRGQYPTGWTAWSLEHPELLEQGHPGQLSRGLRPSCGTASCCSRRPGVPTPPLPRSGRAWKFTRAVMMEGRCWECLHSAAAVNAQMETARVRAGLPPAEPQPSFAEAAGLSPRPSPPRPRRRAHQEGSPWEVASSSRCSSSHLNRTCQVAPTGALASLGKPGETQEAGNQARVPRAQAGPSLPPSNKGYQAAAPSGMQKAGGELGGGSGSPGPSPGIATHPLLCGLEPRSPHL